MITDVATTEKPMLFPVTLTTWGLIPDSQGVVRVTEHSTELDLISPEIAVAVQLDAGRNIIMGDHLVQPVHRLRGDAGVIDDAYMVTAVTSTAPGWNEVLAGIRAHNS